MKVELSKKKKKAVGELGRLKVLSRAGWVLSTCASISFFACTGFLWGLEFSPLDLQHILGMLISGGVIAVAIFIENYVSNKREEIISDLKEM